MNKENHPCKDYHPDNRKNHEAFVNCSKTAIWQNVKDNIICIWKPLKTFTSEIEAASKLACIDKISAKNAQHVLFEQISNFVNKPWSFGCPTPCQQIQFLYEIQYFHKNADTQFYDQVEGVFYISIFYKSLEVGRYRR